jgi:DNA polymerase III subunit epsilon
MKLVAIDFETADRLADSACAIGIVSIEKGKITKKGYRLICPPRRQFVFSCIHGISWADVEAQPAFIEVWDHFASFHLFGKVRTISWRTTPHSTEMS